jgi:hypothetical protein
MTAQFSDIFIFKDVKFELAAFSSDEPFEPEEYQMQPTGRFTSCWRGFLCIYALKENNLILKDLSINLYDETNKTERISLRGPELNSVKPIAPDPEEKHWFFNNNYQNVDLMLDYSGGMLIGNDFIEELYVHMGFHPAWKYKEVFELDFEKGILLSAVDKSHEMDVLRKHFQKMNIEPEINRIRNKKDSLAWIDYCFNRKYTRL